MDINKYKSSEGILVAVDCIIFGFDGRQLQALLIKRGFEPEKGKWSLMGGFVDPNESTDDAAIRVLNQLTGMKNIYMEQLYCFSDVNRDAAGRVISVAYFALINIAEYSDQLQQDHEACWFPMDKIPSLIFDHKEMVAKAKDRLQQKVANHPIGFELLPEKFTLPQLQNLYEAIYEQPLDKRNFTRKILALGILNKLNEKEKESSRKGAFYYVFDKNKYSKLQHEGLKFL
ncbi:MAG TPA: NUDIX domain-containing protein [Chryseolinea sp.]|nr:NUDIX domain-containing protein [Chryseolinea sp.]HPM31572.1 NUDIX domain-containing protein [Chryseolinea sp.]